jgi:hypothetical protein
MSSKSTSEKTVAKSTSTSEKTAKVGKYYGRFIEADKKIAKENDVHLVGFIQETKNYDLFKFMEGNREVNSAHLKKIIESMQEQYLISPIIVNEDFEIMDGQHRFSSCKELGAPILFIQIKGYGINEVQRYNSNNRNWGPVAFMESYIELGDKKYEMYKTVKDTFGFNHKQTLALLSGGKFDGKRDLLKFRNGKLEITKDTDKIYTLGRMIQDFGKFYDGYKRPAFFKSCLVMFKNKKYDHDVMLKKLSKQTDRLQHCATEEGYLKRLGEIFNYHSRTAEVKFV